MKFISWNIDSLNAALTSDSARALLTREVLGRVAAEQADIVAIQETKLPAGGMNARQKEALTALFPAYEVVFSSSCPPARKGYAGTMALVKGELNFTADFPRIGAPGTMDMEGRLITLSLPGLYFNLVYTPNAGDGLKRLADRQAWDANYAAYLAALDADKPVIACGDFNVAHEEIDLANPGSNHRSPGFTDEERAGFTSLLAKGFSDTFRELHKDLPKAYSWWSQRIKTSKANNSGWRIDYFLASQRLSGRVLRSEILPSGERADHAPILLELAPEEGA